MRRIAYLAIAALLPFIADAGPASAQSKELILFNWSNYTPPELLKRFEAETGIKVTLDTYDTNEAMLAKLQAGGTGYDLVVPTGPTVKTMIRDGLLVKSDANQLSNFKNVRPPFDKPDFDPERAYSVPYMWGTTGFAYDSARVPGGKLDDTWKELLEPRKELEGQIGMLADIGEVYDAAAFYLGVDQCTENAADAQKILDLLTKQKPAVKIYSASGTVDRVASGEVILEHMWNGAYHRAFAKLHTAVYVYPREGVNLWGDNIAIPKGAKHLDSAKTFMNFMMDPKNAAEASNFLGYNNAIAGADKFLIDAVRNDPAVNTPESMVARFKPTRECSKTALDLRDKVWTRLRR